MANKKGSGRANKDRSKLASTVGLFPDDVDRTPEQQLWYAVLIEALSDVMGGDFLSDDDFEILCDRARLESDYVRRIFKERITFKSAPKNLYR